MCSFTCFTFEISLLYGVDFLFGCLCQCVLQPIHFRLLFSRVSIFYSSLSVVPWRPLSAAASARFNLIYTCLCVPLPFTRSLSIYVRMYIFFSRMIVAVVLRQHSSYVGPMRTYAVDAISARLHRCRAPSAPLHTTKPASFRITLNFTRKGFRPFTRGCFRENTYDVQ